MGQRHSLTALIEGLVRDPAAAEDIFQEVWIRLVDAAEKGTEIQDLPRWCRGGGSSGGGGCGLTGLESVLIPGLLSAFSRRPKGP
jgi:hypothetical protein